MLSLFNYKGGIRKCDGAEAFQADSLVGSLYHLPEEEDQEGRKELFSHHYLTNFTAIGSSLRPVRLLPGPLPSS